ncbi:MAG: protein kinase, partial [Polyangia bacterium]|nr:protein kinase [Polyangia bacterium]
METEPKSFGRYRLLERLGGGGMAEVWRAEVSYSADVSKVVALKMIREDLVRVPQFLSLFIDEARITSRLSHANVAQVFDFGEEGGRPFLAMELVEGPDLETILRRARELGQHLPLSFCAYVVAEAARGLAAAHGLKDAEGHSFGIVHRDVSPQNVLLSYAGEVKITDFGIARARDKITQTETGTVMGKFRYMSPEQVQGKAVDARSDVFSCGILLYELITGLQLFDGRTSAEVVDQIRYKAVPDLLALRRDVDPALETVLGDTLARDPSARCPDAATLARDLERYLHVAHPLFTRDEVAHLVGALVPRQSPGRVAQMAFAGTELATGAPGGDEPVATAVPEAPEEAASPSGRKATLLGTGEPAPKVTAPARRTAGGPLVVVAPDALEPGCNRQGDEEEGVPEAPMTVSGALGPGGSFSPLPRPAANSPGAVASAALDPAGAAPASAPPVSGVSAGLAPKAPDLSEGAAGTHGSPTAAGSPGADGGNPMAPGGREAHPEVTAPTRLAAPGGPHPGDPEPMSGLDSTRTQARPGAREPATLASRPRRRGVGILLTLAALVLLAGSLTLIFWRLRGPGTQQGGEQEAAAGGGGQADAQVASPPRGDGGGARLEGDSGAASSQSDQVAELDRKLGQLHILRGPRHE